MKTAILYHKLACRQLSPERAVIGFWCVFFSSNDHCNPYCALYSEFCGHPIAAIGQITGAPDPAGRQDCSLTWNRRSGAPTRIPLKCYVSAVIRLGQPMTKTELQIALAEATQTNKRTAALFLDTLSSLAYKAIRKEGEFVLPGFGKLVKQKRKARSGINPKTQQKIKIPAKTVVKFRVAKAAKDAILGVKK